MDNLPPALNQMPQMNNQQMQGGMENQMPEKEPANILAHIAPDEIPYLNEMQGHEVIDPETGLRDYTLLGYMATNFPDVQNALMEAADIVKTKHMAEGGHMSNDSQQLAPELEELRQAGRGDDTELIIITPELADIFDQMHGGKSKINPTTGFPEYGFFKELFRIGAPIVGAVLGGPAGAFAASTVANKVTGKSWGDSLKQGAFSAGIAYGAPYLGSAFQGAFPGASSAMGSATTGIFGNTAGGALNNLFNPQQGMGLMGGLLSGGSSVPASSVGRMLPASAYGTSGGAQAASSAGGGNALGFLENLGGLGKILPIAAQGIMATKGARDEQKSLREYDQKQRKEIDALKNQLGFNTPWRAIKPLNRELSPEYTEEDKRLGKSPSYYKPYELNKIEYMKEGGAIKGFGKGQQDNISKRIPENSYIIDASTVSDIGDGSSDAGYQELDRFFTKLPSHSMHKKQGGSINAKVSNGEYQVSPEKVTALGDGSNERGANFLEQLVAEIRRSKRSSGNKLPPKAKSMGGYLQNLRMA